MLGIIQVVYSTVQADIADVNQPINYIQKLNHYSQLLNVFSV